MLMFPRPPLLLPLAGGVPWHALPMLPWLLTRTICRAISSRTPSSPSLTHTKQLFPARRSPPASRLCQGRLVLLRVLLVADVRHAAFIPLQGQAKASKAVHVHHPPHRAEQTSRQELRARGRWGSGRQSPRMGPGQPGELRRYRAPLLPEGATTAGIRSTEYGVLRTIRTYIKLLAGETKAASWFTTIIPR